MGRARSASVSVRQRPSASEEAAPPGRAGGGGSSRPGRGGPLLARRALLLLERGAQRAPPLDHLVDVEGLGDERRQVADRGAQPVGEDAFVVVLDDLADLRLGADVDERLRVARGLLAQPQRPRQRTPEVEVLARREALDPPVGITRVAEVQGLAGTRQVVELPTPCASRICLSTGLSQYGWPVMRSTLTDDAGSHSGPSRATPACARREALGTTGCRPGTGRHVLGCPQQPREGLGDVHGDRGIHEWVSGARTALRPATGAAPKGCTGSRRRHGPRRDPLLDGRHHRDDGARRRRRVDDVGAPPPAERRRRRDAGPRAGLRDAASHVRPGGSGSQAGSSTRTRPTASAASSGCVRSGRSRAPAPSPRARRRRAP